jgi:hypothetical protein
MLDEKPPLNLAGLGSQPNGGSKFGVLVSGSQRMNFTDNRNK